MAPAPRRIAIALGDPAGIGPEIALKAALDPRVARMCRPLLVGDPRALALHAKTCGLTPRISLFRDAASVAWDEDGIKLLALDQFAESPPVLGAVRAAHGRAAVEAARVAIEAALAGHVDAVVAAPHTEIAIKEAGIAFDGYPGLVAAATGLARGDAYLMLCFDATRIVHLTLHCPLAEAVRQVTRPRVLRVIEKTHEALPHMGIAAPRIAVAGLNPHAGENGLFGNEEIDEIAPAIAAARERGIRVEGPFGADTMLHRPGFDAFIVMYHDQGHIAAKLVAENRTAALTIGTPVLFASVAHGSALDIAGQNRASPAALIEALERLVGARLHAAA
ncbi:MAG TPA: 4-hydroxythreonine-4-phosphate dehydrogenase PdxA [Stellaceae bacterium]|nr:4-hydroxythreonine-4-phosphate dehydrogenase PdxA [Stellaceae bacterium]